MIFLLVIVGACVGCANVPSYNYDSLIARKPRSIVVIPPMNDSVEVNASYTFLSTISRPLAEKGYYVYPVAVIDTFLKENGLPTPAEMNQIPLDKIREHIGADAVLYVRIKDWGQKFRVISSRSVVKAELTLVDTETGEHLWSAKAYAEESGSSNNESGLVGALIGAVVDQIAGSLTDNTYNLSRQAAVRAVNDAGRGLLEGPYRHRDL